MRNQTNPRRHAITLIELIVTVAVLSLLLSQVVTVTAAARKQSRAASCTDKLGRIAKAGLLYSARDPREQAIPVNATATESSTPFKTNYAFGGKSGVGTLDANPIRSDWGARTWLHAATRPLNALLYKTTFRSYTGWESPDDFLEDARLDLDVYHCPEDNQFPGFHIRGWRDGSHARSSYDYFGTSYAANTLWINDPMDPYHAESNSIYLRPLSNVPDPGNTVMYWENAARYAVFADNTEEYGAPSSSPPGQPSRHCRPYFDDEFIAHGWHGQDWNFNAAFGDGHVNNVYVRGYPITQLPDPPATCGPNGARCICVFVRGQGWQLDTLPALPIATDYYPDSSTGVVALSNGLGVEYEIVP